MPSKLSQNGFVDSFNGKLRDELLNRESFHTPAEAKVLIEACARSSTTSAGRTAPCTTVQPPITVP